MQNYVHKIKKDFEERLKAVPYSLVDREKVKMVVEHTEVINKTEVRITDLIIYDAGYKGKGMPEFNWNVLKREGEI
jgi:hypothetical protein